MERIKMCDVVSRDTKTNALRINMKLNRFEDDLRPRMA